MTTIVIGGLFVLLLFNNNSDSLGLTSAVIENVRNNSLINSFSENQEPTLNNFEDSLDEEKVIYNPNDIQFKLSSTEVPQLNKEMKAEKMELIFNDLTTTIKVNDDKLELSDLPEVILEIEGYKGIMTSDENQLSLDGVAKRLEINDISLSTNKEIKISFHNLQYQKAIMIGAEFKNLDFISGSGLLTVKDNLDYVLEEDQVITAYNFMGDLRIEKNSDSDNNSLNIDSSSTLEGFTKGLDIVGGKLNLNLR